jgi:lipoteichoic acid synthase
MFFWFFTLAQVIHFKILNKFFVMSDLSLVGEAARNLNFIFGVFGKKSILFFLFTLLMGIIVFILIKRKYTSKNIQRKNVYILITIILIVVVRYGAVYKLGPEVDEQEWNVWNYSKNVYNIYANSNRSLRVFGVYEYFFRDNYLNIKKRLFNNHTVLINEIEDYHKKKETVLEKNELTGIFENKNLILIMLESIDNWLIMDDTMLTLSEFKKTGWNFINYYSPSFGGGSTLNAEFSALTGLHSPVQGNVGYRFARNLFPYSLPNLFKNNGYSVNSLHFNYGYFYNRTNLHKALGFDNHYALLDMGYSYDTAYDSELINNNNIYKLLVPDNNKFMTFVTTYTAHGPYDKTNERCNQIFADNPSLLSNDDYELNCIKELSNITDGFIKRLVLKLKEDNLLDDTVIVFFTDHFAYSYSKVTSIKNTTDGNLIQNVPFIIWHNNLKSKTIDTYVNSFDLTPTLANLFGLDYNINHYIGTDAFSRAHNNFVYFPDYSWYDGTIYYQCADIEGDLNKDYIIETTKKVNKKITINEAILNSDYYRYIFNHNQK